MPSFDQDSDSPLSARLRKPPRRRRQVMVVIAVVLAVTASAGALHYFGRYVPLSELPAGLAAARDVAYGDLPAQTLDIVFHEDRRKRPAIVMLHEGGWIEGDKSSYHAAMVAWAARGYVTVSVNYRLAPAARFPAAVEDGKCAVRWLRANADEYGIDPAAIGITGWSAGAHLAMMVALTAPENGLEGDGPHREFSSRVQAAVCIAGVYDLLPEDHDRWQAEDDDPCLAALLGGRPSQQQELARRASPVRYLTPDDPPLLVIHGQRDPRIDVQQARDFAAALARLGRTDEVLLHNEGHGVDVFPTTPAEHAAVERFLAAHLAPPKAR